MLGHNGYDEGLVLRKEYEAIGHQVCVSKCNADRLRKEIPTIKVDYNYNPIDDEAVRKAGQEKIEMLRPVDMPLLVSVGRHSKEKGYMRLLDIVARLKTEKYKFALWLVGDGPQHKQLVEYAKEIGVDDVVAFTGAQSNPHKYTSQADVFICSSFVEGYSTACTEAIMLGVPVITTNVSGGEEIIEEAQCGLLTKMDDESLYQAIKSVLEKTETLGEWRTKLLQTREAFSQKVRARNLFNILGIE